MNTIMIIAIAIGGAVAIGGGIMLSQPTTTTEPTIIQQQPTTQPEPTPVIIDEPTTEIELTDIEAKLKEHGFERTESFYPDNVNEKLCNLILDENRDDHTDPRLKKYREACIIVGFEITPYDPIKDKSLITSVGRDHYIHKTFGTVNQETCNTNTDTEFQRLCKSVNITPVETKQPEPTKTESSSDIIIPDLKMSDVNMPSDEDISALHRLNRLDSNYNERLTNIKSEIYNCYNTVHKSKEFIKIAVDRDFTGIEITGHEYFQSLFNIGLLEYRDPNAWRTWIYYHANCLENSYYAKDIYLINDLNDLNNNNDITEIADLMKLPCEKDRVNLTKWIISKINEGFTLNEIETSDLYANEKGKIYANKLNRFCTEYILGYHEIQNNDIKEKYSKEIIDKETIQSIQSICPPDKIWNSPNNFPCNLNNNIIEIIYPDYKPS